MLNINEDGVIQLTRGDASYIKVYIQNKLAQTQYKIQPNDVLTMSIKRSVRDKDPSVQKVVTGSSIFYIQPTDTNKLAFGKYLYDVQITTEAGDVYAVIGPTTFELLTEVTTDE